MSIDDLSDDEEDVLRALRHMASIEARYRVPPHLVAAAKHLQRKGLVREVPWRGPNPPACGTALELLPVGAHLAAQLPATSEDAAFRALRQSIAKKRRTLDEVTGVACRQHDAMPA